MEKVPAPLSQEQQIASLGSKLSSGEIKPEIFLDRVLELDQSDPGRESSVSAADLLSDPRIAGIFTESEQQKGFYSIRSLTYFHRAQIRLSKEEAGAIEDLQRALEDSQTVGVESEDWSNYIRATIAYLNSDMDTLTALAGQVTLNKSLIQNFVEGLQERGHPDYLTDYAKPRDIEDSA